MIEQERVEGGGKEPLNLAGKIILERHVENMTFAWIESHVTSARPESYLFQVSRGGLSVGCGILQWKAESCA